jgi:hypothetical protein
MKLLTHKAPVALLSYIPSARTIILMHMLLEREIAARCTLTHTTRLHRKQGVWAPVHAVCTVQPGRKTPILTKYNQDRLHSHRSI